MIGRIYLIENQLNGHKYVGKTYLTIQERWKQHLSDCNKRQHEHRPLYSAMQKYGIKNFTITLIEETDNLEEKEKYWISYYDSYHNGYNATLGGDGRPYLEISDKEIIEKYNEVLSIKETAKFFHICEKSVALRLKNNNIKIPANGDILNPNRNWTTKEIAQFSLEGELLNTFQSASDAARYLIGLNITQAQIKHIVSNILLCCKNKRKSAYNYLWKYKDN